MNNIRLLMGAFAVAALTVQAHDAQATRSTVSVVLEWNQLLNDTLPAPGGVGTPRFYAMTHIAMFDAINAIEREFEPYRIRLRWGGGAPEAAAAQAAHDVLVAINPNPAAVAAYDAALARQIGSHPSGFVRRGAELGARVADEILAWRQNDGWVVPTFPPYAEPLLPGRWQPTPPSNAAAAFTHVRNAAPMALLSPTQYLPPPPPSLTSERVRNRLQRGEGAGQVRQRNAHRGADGDRAALGRPHHDRRAQGQQASSSSGTTSPATWSPIAISRWSRRRGCLRC